MVRIHGCGEKWRRLLLREKADWTGFKSAGKKEFFFLSCRWLRINIATETMLRTLRKGHYYEDQQPSLSVLSVTGP